MTRPGSAGRAVDLLHELVAIPSVTGAESAVLDLLEQRYQTRGWTTEPIEVTSGRWNLFIHRGRPRVVLTTHADTVPPVPLHKEPRRKKGRLYARGACDAKGCLAAMAVALEELARETDEAGLLVLVGEERGSDGALAANRSPARGVKFLVGGEPTGNRFASGSKGCLRIEVEASGRAGHSSAPESGSSAVPPLLDFLQALRNAGFPDDPVFGPTTMNVGVLHAGLAPNIIADSARAEILFRTGIPVEAVLRKIAGFTAGVRLEVPYRSDPIRFRVPRGSPGEIVSFACDLPLLPAWGEPLLVGPGSILDAHTEQESVDLDEVERAVSIYADVTRGLLSQGEGYLEPPGARDAIDEPMDR